MEQQTYEKCGNCGCGLWSVDAKLTGICDSCIGNLFAWEDKIEQEEE